MAYKSIRNKALKNCIRLITAEYEGKEWSAPDGHFAVAKDIYSNYKVKKDQWVVPNKPDMTNIIPNGNYIRAEAIAETVEAEELIKLENQEFNTSTYVNEDYWNLIGELYPKSTVLVRSGEPYAPVKFMVGEELVALIMPLRLT